MESPTDSLYVEFWDSIDNPLKRLTKIAKQLRQIAVDLEAGKEVAPKKIRKMAGSLDYWGWKLEKAGHKLLFNPIKVMGALFDAREAHKEKYPHLADVL